MSCSGFFNLHILLCIRICEYIERRINRGNAKYQRIKPLTFQYLPGFGRSKKDSDPICHPWSTTPCNCPGGKFRFPAANGFPPLYKDMSIPAWTGALSAGFEYSQQKCDRGKHIGVDCYAASSPAEFFAVLSEVFFERPDVVKHRYPEIYDQFRQYYRQDPLERLQNKRGRVVWALPLYNWIVGTKSYTFILLYTLQS